MKGLSLFEGFPASIDCPFGPYRGLVQYITDGDTLHALIDFGFSVYRYERIRLLGINAPEKNRGTKEERLQGMAAMAHLAWLLPIQTPVMLETEPDPDDFGRYVARITRADGMVVNDQMVADGCAVYKQY